MLWKRWELLILGFLGSVGVIAFIAVKKFTRSKEMHLSYFKLVKIVDIKSEIRSIAGGNKDVPFIVSTPHRLIGLKADGSIKWQIFKPLGDCRTNLLKEFKVRIICLGIYGTRITLYGIDASTGYIVDTFTFPIRGNLIYFRIVDGVGVENDKIFNFFNVPFLSITDPTFFGINDSVIGAFPWASYQVYRYVNYLYTPRSGMNMRTINGMTDAFMAALMVVNPITYSILSIPAIAVGPYVGFIVLKRFKDNQVLVVSNQGYFTPLSSIREGLYHEYGFYIVDPSDPENPIKREKVFHKWYMIPPINRGVDIFSRLKADYEFLPAIVDYAHEKYLVYDYNFNLLASFNFPQEYFEYTLSFPLKINKGLMIIRAYKEPYGSGHPRLSTAFIHEKSILFLANVKDSALNPLIVVSGLEGGGSRFFYDVENKILIAYTYDKLFLFKGVFE